MFLTAQMRPSPQLAFFILCFIALTSCSDGGNQGNTQIVGASNTATQNPASNTATQNSAADPINSDSYMLMAADEDLFRISPTTGEVRKLIELPIGTDFIGPASVVGDKAVITATDNTLNVIDVNTGELLWDFGLGLNESFGDDVEAYCAAPICYAIGSGGDLFAINIETEKSLWEHSFLPGPGFLGFGSSLSQVIMIANDRVYVVGNYQYIESSSLTVLNRFTGEVLQSMDLDDYAYAAPRLVGSVLVVPTELSLRGYDDRTMQLLWNTNFDGLNNGLYRTSPLAEAGNVVAFNSFVETTGDDRFDGRRLVGVDANTGTIMWAINTGDADGFRFNPQSDGTAFHAVSTEYASAAGFRSKQGRPFAVDAQSGRILWKSPENGYRITALESPLVAAGQLYFPSMYSYVAGDQFSGMVRVDAQSGAVTMELAERFATSPTTPIMVHNNNVIRPDPWPGHEVTR